MDVVRRSPLEKIEVLTARLVELEADRERAVAAAMKRRCHLGGDRRGAGGQRSGGAQAVSLAASQQLDRRVLV